MEKSSQSPEYLGMAEAVVCGSPSWPKWPRRDLRRATLLWTRCASVTLLVLGVTLSGPAGPGLPCGYRAVLVEQLTPRPVLWPGTCALWFQLQWWQQQSDGAWGSWLCWSLCVWATSAPGYSVDTLGIFGAADGSLSGRLVSVWRLWPPLEFCWRKREITAALFIPFLPGPSFKTVKDDHDDQLSTTFKARAS